MAGVGTGDRQMMGTIELNMEMGRVIRVVHWLDNTLVVSFWGGGRAKTYRR